MNFNTSSSIFVSSYKNKSLSCFKCFTHPKLPVHTKEPQEMHLSLALFGSGLVLAIASTANFPSTALSTANCSSVSPLDSTEHDVLGGGHEGGDSGEHVVVAPPPPVVPVVVSGGAGAHDGSGGRSEGGSLRDSNAPLGFVLLFAGAVLFWGEM